MGREQAPRRDTGTTLVESLIAVVILGIGVAAILTGILTFIGASNRNDLAAKANTVLVSAAERLRDPARTPYVATCVANPYTPADAVGDSMLPANWTSSTVSVGVKYWDGAVFGEDCYDTVYSALRLQEITVSVTSPDGLASLSMAVVKRGV